MGEHVGRCAPSLANKIKNFLLHFESFAVFIYRRANGGECKMKYCPICKRGRICK